MEATVCSRQRVLAADFRRNMPHSPKAKDRSRAKKCIAADLRGLATDNDQESYQRLSQMSELMRFSWWPTF